MKRFTDIESIAVNRLFWRGVPRRFRETLLESGPNFRNPTRYAVPNEFSGLYFSGNLEQSRKEVASKADGQEDAFVFAQFAIKIDSIVDLSAPQMQKYFSVSLEDIVKPKHLPGAYDATQRIAKIIYTNRLNGILAPSTYDPYNRESCNLVLFPGNIIQERIKEKESS